MGKINGNIPTLKFCRMIDDALVRQVLRSLSEEADQKLRKQETSVIAEEMKVDKGEYVAVKDKKN
jgi:hypothetical protein